jgi:hypothetical protein
MKSVQPQDFPQGMELSGFVNEPFLHVNFDITLAGLGD